MSITLAWEVGQGRWEDLQCRDSTGEMGGGSHMGVKGSHWEQVPNPIKM